MPENTKKLGNAILKGGMKLEEYEKKPGSEEKCQPE